MKRSINYHNGVIYTYLFYEKANLITIDKGKRRERYMLVPYKNKWICSCPSERYRHYCHHGRFVENAKWKKINEPWTEWAEEGMLMRFRHVD